MRRTIWFKRGRAAHIVGKIHYELSRGSRTIVIKQHLVLSFVMPSTCHVNSRLLESCFCKQAKSVECHFRKGFKTNRHVSSEVGHENLF